VSKSPAQKALDEAPAERPEATLFEQAFESAPHALAVFAVDGSVIRANRSFCQMLGFTRAELQTLSCARIVHPDDLLTESEQRRRLAAANIGRYELVIRYVRKDGNSIWVRIAVSAAVSGLDNPVTLIAAAERVASPIPKVNGKVDDQWLRQFGDAAMAAVHEIGNCLTPLMLNTEMILEHAKKKELRDSADQIFKSARRIAFTLRRLRGVDDPPAVAYVGENRMLDLRLLTPPGIAQAAEPDGAGA
jgi:PAS domain S-box-containing protein